MDDKSTSIIPRDEVRILVTEEDKTGEDILAMSDFFGGYALCYLFLLYHI